MAKHVIQTLWWGWHRKRCRPELLHKHVLLTLGVEKSWAYPSSVSWNPRSSPHWCDCVSSWVSRVCLGVSCEVVSIYIDQLVLSLEPGMYSWPSGLSTLLPNPVKAARLVCRDQSLKSLPFIPTTKLRPPLQLFTHLSIHVSFHFVLLYCFRLLIFLSLSLSRSLTLSLSLCLCLSDLSSRLLCEMHEDFWQVCLFP